PKKSSCGRLSKLPARGAAPAQANGASAFPPRRDDRRHLRRNRPRSTASEHDDLCRWQTCRYWNYLSRALAEVTVARHHVPMSIDKRQRRILLGVIAGDHGIHEDVLVRSFTGAPQHLAAYRPLTDATGDKQVALG